MSKEFLQSAEWKKFQESVGRKTFQLGSENFSALIIAHKLSLVGKYFYIPRGPIITGKDEIKKSLADLENLAKINNAGWVRFDPRSDEDLELIRKNTTCEIRKAPHDVQPKEIFVIDIAKSEEELLAEMKPKTRYNLKLAQKKGVEIRIQTAGEHTEEFLRLTHVMAKRQGILAHEENYYRQMLEIIPDDILKLYVAEYEGKVIAANLVIFYGLTCIYLHGASDDSYRSVMAPYLLQWQQILDAKKSGCEFYDFGGVSKAKWQGITKFKTGFSPNTKATVFPGSYDLVIDGKKYWVYRILQKLKNIF